MRLSRTLVDSSILSFLCERTVLDVISAQSFFSVIYSASRGRGVDGFGNLRLDLEETW